MKTEAHTDDLVTSSTNQVNQFNYIVALLELLTMSNPFSGLQSCNTDMRLLKEGQLWKHFSKSKIFNLAYQYLEFI